MHEKLEEIRRLLARARSTLPVVCCRDVALGRRLEWLVAESEGVLAGQCDAGRAYGLRVQLFMLSYDLEQAGYLEVTADPNWIDKSAAP